MDINNFIEKFAEAIEAENPCAITPETEFRNMDEWDSLTYLSVIAFLDEEFDLQIENAEFKKLKTVQNIFDKVSM